MRHFFIKVYITVFINPSRISITWSGVNDPTIRINGAVLLQTWPSPSVILTKVIYKEKNLSIRIYLSFYGMYHLHHWLSLGVQQVQWQSKASWLLYSLWYLALYLYRMRYLSCMLRDLFTAIAYSWKCNHYYIQWV